MLDVRQLNIVIELWGAALCVVLMIAVTVMSQVDRRYRRLLMGMVVSELAFTAGDAAAGLFRGRPGALAWAMTRVGNFVTFAGGFALVGFLTYYLCARVREAGPVCDCLSG